MTVTETPLRSSYVRMRGREFPVGDMCWRRAFPGIPAEARRARDFTRFLLQGSPRMDDVILAGSEMVSNALRHTRSGAPGGLFVLEVRRWRGGTALTVIDQGGPNEPCTRSLDRSENDLFEEGRGLLTIGLTASWWDWVGGPNGRTITAVFYER